MINSHSARLYKHFLFNAFLQAFGLLATLLLGVFLARALGPGGFGIYGLVMAIVAIALGFAQLGLPVLATREAARASSGLDGTSQWSVVRWFETRSAVIGFLGAAATFIFMTISAGQWAALSVTTAFLCALLVWTSALMTVSTALLRGFGSKLLGQGIEPALRPMLGAGLVVYFAYKGLTVDLALVAQIGATVGSLIVATVGLRAFVGSAASAAGGQYRPENWISATLSLSLVTGLGIINANYPLLVAGVFLTSEEIGVLRVALSIAALFALPATVTNLTVGPMAARLAASGDSRQLAHALSHGTIACSLTTLIGLVLAGLGGREAIVILFGHEYVDAFVPLMIIGFAQLIISMFGISGMYLNMIGMHTITTRAFLVSVPAGIAASFALTPWWGTIGTAIGTCVMALVWHLYVFAIRRELATAPLPLWRAIRVVLRRHDEFGGA